MNEKDRSEALKVVEIIGDILQAAHEGCEEAYDHVGQTAMPDKLFRKLSDALDKADELPDIGDEYVRPGWKTAIDTLRQILANEHVDEEARFLAWANKEYNVGPDEELNLSFTGLVRQKEGWMARAALEKDDAN